MHITEVLMLTYTQEVLCGYIRHRIGTHGYSHPSSRYVQSRVTISDTVDPQNSLQRQCQNTDLKDSHLLQYRVTDPPDSAQL
jgi:hypothetical protein